MIDMIVDLQYGSTGKGLFAGYLAKMQKYDTAITANMPNAGHTFMSSDGRKIVLKVLPCAAVSDSINRVMIGPGAVFNPDVLMREIKELNKFRGNDNYLINIHPNATVLAAEHAEEERKRLNHIASTMQGSMEAVIHKMRRQMHNSPIAKVALKGTELEKFVVSHSYWRIALENCNGIAEGSQGFSLGIDTEFYPYTTSRNCTPASFLNAMGIPLPMLSMVYGTMRTFPIRVGNVPDGYSGDCYPDQEETNWDELGQTPEFTTVTKRVRRIFTFSKMQIRDAIWECRPDYVFLNFCNYADDDKIAEIIETVNDFGSVVKYLGFGPLEDDIEESTLGTH